VKSAVPGLMRIFSNFSLLLLSFKRPPSYYHESQPMEARRFLQPQASSFELSLRIRHPFMDPAVLSRELGLEPECSFRVGDPRPPQSDRASATVHAESYWLAVLDPSSWLVDVSFAVRSTSARAHRNMGAAAARSLDLALSLSALRLRSAHAVLLNQIRSEGGQASLLIALFPAAVSGFTLTPDVSRIFSELGIALEVEFTDH
jgi:hypothetical protein